MRVRLGLLACAVTLGWLMLTPAADAQRRRNRDDIPLSYPSIPEAFVRIDGERNFYGDASMIGDSFFLLGLPSFKDNELVGIGRRVNILYRDMLQQQGGTEVLRTRDLDTPFCTSLYGNTAPCNFVVENPIPPPTPTYFFPEPAPLPPAPPVRALY